MVSNYSCIYLSEFEVKKTKTHHGFLPKEIYNAETLNEKKSIFKQLNKKNILNFMAIPEFYQFIIEDKEKAISEYKKVISNHGSENLPLMIFNAPFTVEIFSRIQIAKCYQDIHDYEKAIEFYKYGYPWYPFYFEIAECFKLLRDKTNANVYYLKAIEFHSSEKWGSTALLVFRAYLEMGEKKGALNFLKNIMVDCDKEEAKRIFRKIIDCLEDQEPDFAEEIRNKIKIPV